MLGGENISSPEGQKEKIDWEVIESMSFDDLVSAIEAGKTDYQSIQNEPLPNWTRPEVAEHDYLQDELIARLSRLKSALPEFKAAEERFKLAEEAMGYHDTQVFTPATLEYYRASNSLNAMKKALFNNVDVLNIPNPSVRIVIGEIKPLQSWTQITSKDLERAIEYFTKMLNIELKAEKLRESLDK